MNLNKFLRVPVAAMMITAGTRADDTNLVSKVNSTKATTENTLTDYTDSNFLGTIGTTNLYGNEVLNWSVEGAGSNSTVYVLSKTNLNDSTWMTNDTTTANSNGDATGYLIPEGKKQFFKFQYDAGE
jgi:hypothetical protein